jgi:hypothetical protein
MMTGLISLSDFLVFCFAASLPITFFLAARHLLTRIDKHEQHAPAEQPPSHEH